jgi:hypothetical protein
VDVPPHVAADRDSPAQTHDPSQIGEVQTGKGPEQLSGRAVVGPGRLDLVGEEPKPNAFAEMLDDRQPLAASLVPEHAFESGCPAGFPPIPDVLGLRTHAEVVPPIVLPIAVGVIDHLSRRRVHDEPVHEDVPAADLSAGVTRPRCTPRVSAEPLEVGRIDDGRASIPEADIPCAFDPAHLRRRRLPFPAKPPAVHDDPPPRHVGQFPFVSRVARAEQPIASPVPDARRTAALSARTDHRLQTSDRRRRVRSSREMRETASVRPRR